MSVETEQPTWEQQVQAAFANLTLPSDEELVELCRLVMSGGPNAEDGGPNMVAGRYIFSNKDLWQKVREVRDTAFHLRTITGRRSLVPK